MIYTEQLKLFSIKEEFKLSETSSKLLFFLGLTPLATPHYAELVNSLIYIYKTLSVAEKTVLFV